VNLRSGALLRDTFLACLRHGVPVALGALSLAVTARALGPAPLGFWNLLGTAAFLLGLADLGLSGASLRAAAAGRRGEALSIARWSARRALQLGIPAALLAGGWLALMAGHLAPEARTSALFAVPIALGAGLILAASQAPRAYLHGTGRVGALSIARIAASVVQATVTVALVGSLGASGVALGYALAVLVEVGIVLRAFRQDTASPEPLDAGTRADASVIARSLLLGNIAVAVCMRGDILLLELRFDLGLVAAYATTSRLVDQLFTGVKQLGFALVPRLGGRSAERGQLVAGGALALGTLGAAVLAPMGLEGAAIVRLVAGAALDPVVVAAVAPWMATAALVVVVAEIPQVAVSLGARGALVGRVATAGALVNLAITALAVYARAPWLSAAATLVGNLLVAGSALALARQDLGWSRAQLAAIILPPALALGAAWAFDLALARTPLPALARVALLPPFTLACGALVAFVTARRTRLLGYTPVS
jgi:O-antigen/teichoic acid export membrane protein